METMRKRAQDSMATFGDAVILASENGMAFTNPSDACYQLRHNEKGWILNMYPRNKGFSGRLYADPHHKPPFILVKCPWTLLDAVTAAINAERRLTP